MIFLPGSEHGLILSLVMHCLNQLKNLMPYTIIFSQRIQKTGRMRFMVHGCRRVLQDLADLVFPPTKIPRKKGKKEIKLGSDQYINRIIAFTEDASKSKRFKHVVGSHLEFLGECLDSIFEAAQKGSHANILEREEADRYVAFTYLIVGDILSLTDLADRQG